HVIHVWDTEGGLAFSCEEFIINNVQVIDYPHYFTPNGDGIHDTWNVRGLESFSGMTKIYIFDRYGKLLKQISSAGDGWDGTYNGQPLPSTDYWFTVDYPEQGGMKQFKAHFSLKR
ncbi:T9SS type B sorting domain-containing protein, partial [Flavobacterium sp.]|uniref:T9SS type B sorting domain-containing protein n=1 Tax=Flavobacterium sp. TaxID=239 RepID=UPI003918DE01